MALLTPQGLKKVFQCQKPEGREHLRRLLHWEQFDELRDARRSILLDILYESIIFAVGKGFPWVEVAKVVKFAEELLRETKVKDAALKIPLQDPGFVSFGCTLRIGIAGSY
uniref:Chromosome 2 C8orf74 homolog n=1 Tax=Equus caballus TaxID=9796 RepID=A0A9L0TGH7_HORSE